MAADSSFDPLALVKAMGPQRDPYSWAEAYAADASKSAQLREEIKSRLLIHESDQKARASEGAANRASHEGIAKGREAGAAERLKQRLGVIGSGGAKRPIIMLPEGSLSADEHKMQSALRRLDPKKKYVPVDAHGKLYHIDSNKIEEFKRLNPNVPIGGGGVIVPGAEAPTAAATAAKRSIFEEDVVGDE